MEQYDPPEFSQDTWHIDYGNTWDDQPLTGEPRVWTDAEVRLAAQVDITPPAPVIPQALMMCVVCGVDDVLIFCDACREVIREARKQWARDFLEEIEDALS